MGFVQFLFFISDNHVTNRLFPLNKLFKNKNVVRFTAVLRFDLVTNSSKGIIPLFEIKKCNSRNDNMDDYRRLMDRG